jgi:DNA-directed RNA polymerase specialized sigma24 family protein
VRHPQPVARRDATTDYRKLIAALAARAARMGSRDAEGAAQEALKRSLANSTSRAAIDYYFQERPPAGLDAPAWPLEQLFAWLHGVLRFVVQEERARVGYHREMPVIGADAIDVRDPSPDQLEVLIDDQLQTIVRESLSSLSEEYRTVLTLRMRGLKYADIAARLGVNENTVATWVRRGTQAAVQQVRDRMDYRPRLAAVGEPQDGKTGYA